MKTRKMACNRFSGLSAHTCGAGVARAAQEKLNGF